VTLMQERQEEDAVDFLVSRDAIPSWFMGIGQRLRLLSLQPDGVLLRKKHGCKIPGGGNGSLCAAARDHAAYQNQFLSDRKELKGIVQEGNRCHIGAAVTVTDLMESPVIQRAFPEFHQFARLVSSTPIRNIATLAGNFANASPIGDFTISSSRWMRCSY